MSVTLLFRVRHRCLSLPPKTVAPTPETVGRQRREGWHPTSFSDEEFLANLKRLPVWNDRFEVPDQIGFRDIVQYPNAFVESLPTGSEIHPGALTKFPYPKGGNRIRWMSIASPRILFLSEPLQADSWRKSTHYFQVTFTHLVLVSTHLAGPSETCG